MSYHGKFFWPKVIIISCFQIILVKRLVKHTGYGNAAGLLASRGLMAGGSGSGAAQYSDDEDSDTEEYKEKAHM